MEATLFSNISTFALLVGLELVLGIDNVLLISILSDRLPAEKRKMARNLGLGLALGFRVILVMGAAYLVKLNDPVIGPLSWKSIILLAGGAFLLFKSVKEIHHVVEGSHAQDQADQAKLGSNLRAIIFQIVLLDIVFSIDSVITAVGLTPNLWIIESAVVVSFMLVMLFASKISGFINGNPALKVLALSFLICIGITLGVEGLGKHVDKGYIYLPMGFAFMVELLQMRQAKNSTKKSTAPKGPAL